MRNFKIHFQYNLLLFFLVAGLQFCTANFCPGQGKDRPQWGEKYSRNMVSDETGLPATFNILTGKNVKWSVSIGSDGYSSPIIANGKVLIGTNNAEEHDPRHKGDRGVVLCLNESDGSFFRMST